MLLILPAIMPVLIIFVIRESKKILEKKKPIINIDEDKIEEFVYKVLKYGLVPICILGAISIKALGIYMAVGSILGIILLLTHYYYFLR